jgi:hypothetical protein
MIGNGTFSGQSQTRSSRRKSSPQPPPQRTVDCIGFASVRDRISAKFGATDARFDGLQALLKQMAEYRASEIEVLRSLLRERGHRLDEAIATAKGRSH